jgi:hypothetical protein
MSLDQGISVVVPTLNCARLLGDHVASMQPWLHLVAELIVVDSFSEDGSAEMARRLIRHPALRILEHPRGLYQSWNHGIAATSGRWVYISTVGDPINASHLEALLKAGEEHAADVVVSPPRFIDNEGKPVPSLGWPIEEVVRLSQASPFCLGGRAAAIIANKYRAMSILGSSASNLYRGSVLRARPFPTDYGMVGDTAWGLLHLRELRLLVHPAKGSSFRLHPKAYSATAEGMKRELEARLGRLARGWLDDRYPGPEEEARMVESLYHEKLPRFLDAKAAYRVQVRKLGAGWFLRSAAWRLRAEKNRAQRGVASMQKIVDAKLAEALAESSNPAATQ